jgi:hypothetical protein
MFEFWSVQGFRFYFLGILSRWGTRPSQRQGAAVNVGSPAWHYSISNLPEPDASAVMTPTPSVLIGAAVKFGASVMMGYTDGKRWWLRPWGLLLVYVVRSM